jgi:hypothetical protein
MTATTCTHRSSEARAHAAGVRAAASDGPGRRAAPNRPARSAPGRPPRTPMLRPRRPPTRSRTCPRPVCAPTRCTASTAAHRTNRLPCLSVASVSSSRVVPRAAACSLSSPVAVGASERCRGPGSGVSPTAERPQGLEIGAGLAHRRRVSEKIGWRGSAATHDRSHRCRPGSAVRRGASGAPAYLGARPRRVRRQDGDRGVSTGAAARSWSAVPARGPAATGLPGADRRFIGGSGAARGPGIGEIRRREIRRRGRGPGRRGCAVCGGSGGRAFGPWTATPADRPDGP